jgi:hypothetical protein
VITVPGQDDFMGEFYWVLKELMPLFLKLPKTHLIKLALLCYSSPIRILQEKKISGQLPC